MKAPRMTSGLLGLMVALVGTGGCLSQAGSSIVVDKAAGVSGAITNDMPFADAKKLLADAGVKERVGDIAEGPGPIADHRFNLADGSPFQLSVEKTTGRVKTIKYCDAATVKRRPEWWRWRILTVYRIEDTGKKDSPPAPPAPTR